MAKKSFIIWKNLDFLQNNVKNIQKIVKNLTLFVKNFKLLFKNYKFNGIIISTKAEAVGQEKRGEKTNEQNRTYRSSSTKGRP